METSPFPLVIATAPAPVPGLGRAEPRIDYLAIAAELGARVVYPDVGSPLARLLDRRVLRGGNWRHAWSLRRERPAAFLTLSETSGLPLALLARGRVPHVMIAHNLTTARRRAFQRRTRFLDRIDRIIVLSRAQERYLREEVGLAAERVVFVHDKVDHQFFAAQGPQRGGYVLSVGREQRDYATLVEAVRGTDLRAIIVPSSLWMPMHEIGRGALPPNVEVRHDLPFAALRELYAGAAVIAVPIRPGVDYAAGVNGVLEGMAMAKPVVVSDSPGLEGYLEPSVVRVVPPGNPAALREALTQLVSAPAESQALGRRARAAIDGGRNLDGYVSRVVEVVKHVMR